MDGGIAGEMATARPDLAVLLVRAVAAIRSLDSVRRRGMLGRLAGRYTHARALAAAADGESSNPPRRSTNERLSRPFSALPIVASLAACLSPPPSSLPPPPPFPSPRCMCVCMCMAALSSPYIHLLQHTCPPCLCLCRLLLTTTRIPLPSALHTPLTPPPASPPQHYPTPTCPPAPAHTRAQSRARAPGCLDSPATTL